MSVELAGRNPDHPFELLAEMAPEDVKIIRGYVSGNRAALRGGLGSGVGWGQVFTLDISYFNVIKSCVWHGH